MDVEEKDRRWKLLVSLEYADEIGRLPSKYRGQISRKVKRLERNPKPGGSKTPLKGYSGLYRLRAGDFRVIYTYDDSVVQVLTLRRRDASTYDDLDALEILQLKQFQTSPGSGGQKHNIANWEEATMNWAAPKPKPVQPLPRRISEVVLQSLEIPAEFWPPLLAAATVEDLQDCEQVPFDFLRKLIDDIWPSVAPAPVSQVIPIIVIADLIDQKAAGISGPIDLGEVETTTQVTEVPAKPIAKGPTKKKAPLKRTDPPMPLHFISIRRQEPMTPYRGNTSKGIGKDAKYTVKLDNTIQLEYTDSVGDQALLTTDEHPELVALVNEAKRTGGSRQGGGGFLINEYRHVLVPTIDGPVLFAGAYTMDLEFMSGRKLVSPVAPPDISPGDIWPGPHVGIKYTLASGAADVRYETDTGRGERKRICLTDHHPAGSLAELLGMFRAVKPTGGAVYINEARELFAPVDDGNGYKRRYIGHLGTKPWFPEPS